MTKPVPKPQFRSADYSLRYQVMLDSLNSQHTPGVTPLQLNVSPPGVNDLNRPMLINTTTSRWRELGLGTSITRPKYQRRRAREPAAREHLEREKKAVEKEEELAAMGRLLQEARVGDKENVPGKRNGLADKSQQVKRSKSEPMHLPPIEEGPTPPGLRTLTTPAQPPGRHRFGGSPANGDVRRQPRSNSRADSMHALPTLSRVKDEKSRYVDSSFIRGVQRHTGRLNMNLAMGKPPRAPRHSWEDGRTRISTDNPQHHPHPPPGNPELRREAPTEVPVRLRDMDLGGVFPVHNKMEGVRQWHEEQFRKHLEQWKHTATSETADNKHAEALELLAKYKLREGKIPGITRPATCNATRAQVATAEAGAEQQRADLKTAASERALKGQRLNTPAAALNVQGVVPGSAHSHRPQPPVIQGTTQNTQSPPRLGLDVDWRRSKAAKGANSKVVQEDDECVYKDAKEYIEDNNLLPPEKCRRIQDWVNQVELTSDCSGFSTSSSYSLTSDCSESDSDLELEKELDKLAQ